MRYSRSVRSAVAATTNPLRVGFFGAGDISTLHAAALRRSPRATLAGLWNRAGCAIVPDAAAKAAEYECELYSSAEALATDPSIDAIYILTNMESHCELAQLAMRSGKHVYIEKPVGSSVAEVEAMAECAAETGVVCFPGHNYVYEPGVRRARELIDAGDLGDIAHLAVSYNIQHPAEVCARLPGVIRQILTHHAYVSLFLLGATPPTTLSAMSSIVGDELNALTRENIAAVLMKHGDRGALTSLEASFAGDDHTSDPWSFYIKVLGTKGGARYSYNDWVVNAKEQVHSHVYVAYPHTIAAASEHFIECVLDSDATVPLSTMADAIAAQKIVEAAEESAKSAVHVTLV